MKKNKHKFSIPTATSSCLLQVLLLCIFIDPSSAQLIVYNSGVTTTIQSGLAVTIQGGFTNQVQAATNGAVDNQGTMNVSGAWANTSGNTVFSSAAGLVNLNGSGAQTIGGTATTNFYNLTLANTFGTIPQFTLGIAENVRNNLTMTSGKMNLATYTLTLGTAAATPGTLTYTADWLYGGTFTRWMNTPIIAIGNTAGHFPMGSSTDYRPLWVANTAVLTTGGTISAVHTPVLNSTAVSFADASWGNTVIFTSKSFWTLSTSAISVAGSSFSLRMQATGMGRVAAVSDLNLTLAASVVGTHVASAGTITNPQVNRTGLTLNQLNNTSTSQNFYFGSKSAASPLPVELLSFNAVLNDDKIVDLHWITASETNNDYFTIEKTKDGMAYEEVERVKGAGNSIAIKQYDAKDYNPYKNRSYYRLKQTDFNGHFEYSKLAPVENTEKAAFKVFPNPLSEGNLFISLQHGDFNEIKIVIYDMLGKICFSKTATSEDGDFFTTLEFFPPLQSGIYLVSVSTPQEVYREHLVVK